MIPSTADPLGRPADPNFTAGRVVITLTSMRPAVSNANTHNDDTAQAAGVGDTNPGTLGAGGTVGVDNLTLATVNRPEVELRDGNTLNGALDLEAPSAAVRGLAIFGFGNDTLTQANILVGANASGAVIEQYVLGSSATGFTQPGPGARTCGGTRRLARRPDRHGHDQPRRPVRPQQRQQHGQRHRGTAGHRPRLSSSSSWKGGTACHPNGGSARR